MGTLVEIITFHLLKAWGLEQSTLIERKLPQYANTEISHNVEFTLYPSEMVAVDISIEHSFATSITSRKILSKLPPDLCIALMKIKTGSLLSKDGLQRNACVLAEDNETILAANLNSFKGRCRTMILCELFLRNAFWHSERCSSVQQFTSQPGFRFLIFHVPIFQITAEECFHAVHSCFR